MVVLDMEVLLGWRWKKSGVAMLSKFFISLKVLNLDQYPSGERGKKERTLVADVLEPGVEGHARAGSDQDLVGLLEVISDRLVHYNY